MENKLWSKRQKYWQASQCSPQPHRHQRNHLLQISTSFPTAYIRWHTSHRWRAPVLRLEHRRAQLAESPARQLQGGSAFVFPKIGGGGNIDCFDKFNGAAGLSFMQCADMTIGYCYLIPWSPTCPGVKHGSVVIVSRAEVLPSFR